MFPAAVVCADAVTVASVPFAPPVAFVGLVQVPPAVPGSADRAAAVARAHA